MGEPDLTEYNKLPDDYLDYLEELANRQGERAMVEVTTDTVHCMIDEIRQARSGKHKGQQGRVGRPMPWLKSLLPVPGNQGIRPFPRPGERKEGGR